MRLSATYALACSFHTQESLDEFNHDKIILLCVRLVPLFGRIHKKKRGYRTCCPFPRLEAFAMPVLVGTKQRRGPREYVSTHNDCILTERLQVTCGLLHIQVASTVASVLTRAFKEVAKFQDVRTEASSKRFQNVMQERKRHSAKAKLSTMLNKTK